MKKIKRRCDLIKGVLAIALLLGVLITGSSHSYAAGETWTYVGDTSNPLSTEVKFHAYYEGNDAYMLTEDTNNLPTAPVAPDYLINDLNKGYVNPIFMIAKSVGGNWPTSLTSNTSTYKVWITNTTNQKAASADGVYNSSANNYANPLPGAGSSNPNRLTLLSGNYLATPVFSAIAGNGSVMLTWQPVSGTTISYAVYKRTSTSPKGTNNWIAYGKLTETTNLSYADTSASNGTNYYYMIIAKEGTTKQSAHSDEIQVQPSGSLAPTVTSVFPVSGNNANPTVLTIAGAAFTGAIRVSLESISAPVATISLGTVTDNQISATVQSGITPGSYYVVVTTPNGQSTKTSACMFQVLPDTSPPNTPSGFSMTGKTTNEINWGWSDVAGEDQYGLFNSSNSLVVVIPANTTTTKEVSGPNVRYQRKLASHNTYGYSGYTSLIDTYTNALPPYNVTAEAVNPSTIKVYWLASNGGTGNPPAKYEVQRAPDVGGSPGSWTSINSNVTTTWYSDGTCQSATKYHYQVRAFNGSDDMTNFSNITFETTPPGPPVAPTLQTSSRGVSTTSIQWDILDNSNNELGFAVCNTSNTKVSGDIAASIGTGLVVSTVETGLSGPNLPTVRKASAFNGTGTNYSSTITVHTLAAPPTGLTASPMSTKRVQLNWSGSAPKYRVERSTTGDFSSGVEYSFDSMTAATQDATLTAGSTRYFRVKSYNNDSVINQTPSSAMPATTLAALPAPINATAEVLGISSIIWSCTDEATGEDGYRLMSGPATICAIPGEKTGTEPTVTTVESGLTPCKQYTRAWSVYRNNDDSTSSATVTRSTKPVRPGTPTFSGKNMTSITMNLNPGTNEPTGLQYIIETKEPADLSWTVLSTGYAGTNTLYTHGGLAPGSVHSYRTTAKNSEAVTSEYSSIYTDSTMLTGTDGEAPVIVRVMLNQRMFVNNDILSATHNIISIVVTDRPTIGAIGIGTVEVTVDEGQAYEQKVALTQVSPDTWNGIFGFQTTPQNITNHTVKIYARDLNSNATTRTLNGIVISGGVQMIEVPLNYPNPFRPLSPDPSKRTTTIQYTLSSDTPITIVMFDITGQEVKRWVFSSGTMGAKAGLNSITWDGKSMFNQVVGNGMFVYKIFTKGKVIGTGKLVVLD